MITELRTPLSVLVAETTAPGMTAPVASLTVPVTLPPPAASEGTRSATSNTTANDPLWLRGKNRLVIALHSYTTDFPGRLMYAATCEDRFQMSRIRSRHFRVRRNYTLCRPQNSIGQFEFLRRQCYPRTELHSAAGLNLRVSDQMHECWQADAGTDRVHGDRVPQYRSRCLAAGRGRRNMCVSATGKYRPRTNKAIRRPIRRLIPGTSNHLPSDVRPSPRSEWQRHSPSETSE